MMCIAVGLWQFLHVIGEMADSTSSEIWKQVALQDYLLQLEEVIAIAQGHSESGSVTTNVLDHKILKLLKKCPCGSCRGTNIADVAKVVCKYDTAYLNSECWRHLKNWGDLFRAKYDSCAIFTFLIRVWYSL